MYMLLLNRFTFLCFSCFYCLYMYLFSLWATIFNKNLYSRDGSTICGPQCVPKSTSVTLTKRRKDVTMATITGRTDRQSATQYAA